MVLSYNYLEGSSTKHGCKIALQDKPRRAFENASSRDRAHSLGGVWTEGLLLQGLALRIGSDH
eukprot:2659855-Amphidinium_carterae.1